MKILMLGWELPPHNSGGLGVACYQLCQALSKKDIDIEFILPYKSDHNIDFMKITPALPYGAKVVQNGGSAYDSRLYQFTPDEARPLNVHQQQEIYTKAVEHITDQNEYDIVHAHDWLTFRSALRIKEKKNIPIILHVHSVESDRAGSTYGNPLIREVEWLGLSLADRIIAISNHTKRAIVHDYGIPPNKIEVVHNSIGLKDTGRLQDINAYTYLNAMKEQGYKIAVNVGRLTVQKGLPNLLRAFQMVVEIEPKSLLLIVGSGEQYHELIRLANELGIGKNVVFTDFQRGKKLRDAFRVGDLFIMPSVSEPFGLTPLEAIGYGTPVLISKQSGVSEVLKNGLKVDFWDTHEMANKIVAVFRSNELKNELQTNSYAEFSKMSWDEAGHKVTKLYEEHLSEACV